MVFLFSEKENRLLRGRVHCLLAPFLTGGEHTADEIVTALEKELSPAEIYYALERLKKAHLIAPVTNAFSAGFSAFCQTLGVRPEDAARKLKRSRVFISSVGGVEKTRLSLALKELGIQITSKEADSTFSILLCDDYLNVALAPLQKQLFIEKRPYLMAKPIGYELWLGPLFSKETGCGHCMATRLKRNRLEETYVQNQNGDHSHFPTSVSELPTTLTLAASWLATEIFKTLIFSDAPHLKGKMLSFNLSSSKIDEHHLIRLPLCSLCGKRSKTRPLSPLTLQPRTKGVYDDNGHRCIPPEETLSKHAHQISPILGVVKFLKKEVRVENSALYLYTAGFNFALSNADRGIYRRSLRSASSGKGKSETQAKTSALCEAIERYSGQFFGDERRVRATFAGMNGQAIHPNQCLQFSKKQYAERARYNKSDRCFEPTPAPFSEKAPIDWSPVWSLTERRYKYLPSAFCYYGYPRSGRSFCMADSNGNAAGNTLEEAILQGFFELVERDAVAIWWYNRLRRPAVDLASFKDPYLSRVLAEYKAMNREVWVLDITTDLNIPTFAALSRRVDQKDEEIYLGFGTHLQPEIALLRAVTEMNQFISFEASWNLRQGEEKESHNRVANYWFKNATVANQPYLNGTAMLSANNFPQYHTQDLLDDILFCQKSVEDRGMEMLILDQTRPDIDLKVVKVVVPGLRHFWRRFAPGRLYDVPVKMGWINAPLQEEDFNPIPFFL